MTNPTESEWAWIAGIIEGEGYLEFRKVGKYTKTGIKVRMTDFDVVEKLKYVSGVGLIYRNIKVTGNRKPTIEWQVYGHDKVKYVLIHCKKWFGKRRGERADLILRSMPIKTPHPVEKIKELYKQGVSQRQIAKEVGICFTSVNRIIKNGTVGHYHSLPFAS